MTAPAPRAATSSPCGPLRGSVRVIGDKSLTHRALLLASLADGKSRILHPNPGEDCRATARAIERLGAEVRPTTTGWELIGGRGCLHDPDDVLDLGNSGTGMRLLAGMIAGRALTAVLTGDASLRARPMRRIAEPLAAMGATVLLRRGEFPPISVRGGRVKASVHRLPVASAQVKGCVLLAALGLEEGEVVVTEPGPSRDHTERLLEWLSLPIARGEGSVTLRGPVPRHHGFEWSIPSDISAAAFYMVAATLVSGSDVRLDRVLLNPTRTGVLDVLRAMGADIAVEPDEPSGPEPTGSIRVRASSLRGATVEGALLVRALDEIPVLAVAAAAAEGDTAIRDARELRVKESDRIESTASLARALGAPVDTGPDWLVIHGQGRLAGGTIRSRGDHRIAMSGVVAGCAARGAVTIDDTTSIATSDPTFLDRMVQLGARIA